MEQIKKFSKNDIRDFFEWVLEKPVKMHQEKDITLVMSEEKPYIYYPDEIKKVLETAFMQRLGRITQLGSAVMSIPTFYHTRLAHCKGAGYNATKFYVNQFENDLWKEKIEQEDKKLEIFADILQMYVHDIGHNVLSHELENLIESKKYNNKDEAAHEILGKRILNEDKEIVEVFNSIHPELLANLNKVMQTDYELRSLKEGTIDFDRLDFLVRDSLYLGEEEERESTDRIIQNCEIVDIEKNGYTYRLPVYNENALGDIKKLLEKRADYYKNVYCSDEKKAMKNVSLYFFKKLDDSDYDCELKNFINYCSKNGGDKIDLEKFKKWDDVRYYNEIINIAKNCPDREVQELAIYCLPSAEGLVNLSYELLNWTDKTVDSLEGYQKEFYENVKDIVKKPSELQKKLLLKEKNALSFISSNNKENIDKALDEIENKGIGREKLSKMMSWKSETNRFYKNKAIFVKKENGNVDLAHMDLNSNPKNMNYGVVAFPMQMKENGFTDDEIEIVKKVFKHIIKKNNLNIRNEDKRSVYEKEDMIFFR